jgi:hypothetical protein
MFRCFGKFGCRLWLLLLSGLDWLKEFNSGSFYAFVIVSGFALLSPALSFALGFDGLENSLDHQAVVVFDAFRFLPAVPLLNRFLFQVFLFGRRWGRL